jgi:hypothetical protein
MTYDKPLIHHLVVGKYISPSGDGCQEVAAACIYEYTSHEYVHTYIQEQNSNAKLHIPSPRPITTVEREDTVSRRGCRE